MLLHDHFDVAILLGHPAFEHLAEAMGVYDSVKRNGWLTPASYSWAECFSIGGQLNMLRKTELKQCVQSIILFQAMMEKVPYFVPSIGSGLTPGSRSGFANTWEELLVQIKDSAIQGAAKVAFNYYNKNFYKAFRNPIIHGKEANDIAKINKIRVPNVYEGIRKGWRAYDYLLTEAFAPDQTHEPSWAVMCATHCITDTLDINDYPDLHTLELEYNKRHLDGVRAATDSME